MTANIEQIFQDFILNKIKEIEDQSQDKTTAEGAGAVSEMVETEKGVSERDKNDDLKGRSSQKKHKKHKKRKSKKKKRNRAKEDRESNTDSEGGSKYQPRKRTTTDTKTIRGEDHDSNSRGNKQHTTGKRKKKKRRRKDEENSSDSDSEFVLKQDSKSGQNSPKQLEELPDIIPKQDCSTHSYSHSHSCRARRSRTDSTSSSHQPWMQPSLPDGSSSENRAESSQLTQGPATDPQQPCSPNQRNNKAEEPRESSRETQNPDQSEKPAEKQEEKAAETTQQPGLGTTSGTAMLTLNQTVSTEADQTTHPSLPQVKGSTNSSSLATDVKPSTKKKRKSSKSPQRKKESNSSKRQKRTRSPYRNSRRGSRSRSRSPLKRKRSRSRSGGRKSRRSYSRSASRDRRRVTYSQRDRWKREPSHSPVLILRKNRSPSRKNKTNSSSPQRISELDKDQLLEIAKANAAVMCAKAGIPIPASLRSTVLPLTLPSMAMNAAATMTASLSKMGVLSSLLSLPSIANKPLPVAAQPNISVLEEMKRKVTKQANNISIKEFTDKCKMIVDSKGELPLATPHVSDEEDDGKPFGGSAFREQKAISFSINNTTVRPAVHSDAGMAKEFPVSSGSQHRKKEGEALGAYGEWVPVDMTADKVAATSRKALATVPIATATSNEMATAAGQPDVYEMPSYMPDNDSVFPEPPLQPVDISQAVIERIKAQRRLAENPYDVNAICMLSRAQDQVDAWAQFNTVPGLFTGSTGAQILSSEELSTSGPQAWLKKDQFLRAAPVSGGVGEFLMRKMGWRTGEGLGRNREGTVEPIVIDFKVDRKGLVAEGEKPQKQTGGLVVTKDLMGKHPVSALIELCNKKRVMQPDFVMVHHSGPDHRKNFLFKVSVNGVDYQPQTASPNKKHAKAMAATVALQALGEVPADGPGLYTGPVFTAASTGPLFST